MIKDCFACGRKTSCIWQDADGTIHNKCPGCGFHFRNDYLACSSAVEQPAVNRPVVGSIPTSPAK